MDCVTPPPPHIFASGEGHVYVSPSCSQPKSPPTLSLSTKRSTKRQGDRWWQHPWSCSPLCPSPALACGMQQVLTGLLLGDSHWGGDGGALPPRQCHGPSVAGSQPTCSPNSKLSPNRLAASTDPQPMGWYHYCSTGCTCTE